MKRMIILLIIGILLIPALSFSASKVLAEHFTQSPVLIGKNGNEYKYLLKCYQEGNMILNENLKEAPTSEVVGNFLFIRNGLKDSQSNYAVISAGTACFVENAN